MRHCRGQRRFSTLLKLSTWQYPWREAVFTERLQLEHFRGTMTGVQRILQMPALLHLPGEIRQTISNYAHPSLVERYGNVLNLIDDISSADRNCATTPLGQIYRWQRGTEPAIQQTILEPFMRMTIDARGLFMVERLTELPQDSGFRSEGMVYVVEPADRLSEAEFHFMVFSLPTVGSAIVYN